MMNKKNLLSALFVFILAACELPIADALLDGTWTAVSGAQLEFLNGKFTRTLVTGGVETGTYTAESGYITFNRSGYTPEKLPYKLDRTCLTVDTTEYYRNSPGIPDEIEGRWTPYPEYGSAISFGKGKPQKGNPGIIEGDFINMMGAKGTYTISNRNIPGSNILTTIPTHVHGSNISTFVEERLRVSILELFDLTLLEAPSYPTEEWWFTLDEMRKFFENAAGKAQTLEDQAMIISAMQFFFYNFESVSYDYSIEEDKELQYDYIIAAGGKNKLTLREYTIYGPYIFTYFKIKDDFGEIGQEPGATPDPTNPWVPF
jgi:hypothetical protein